MPTAVWALNPFGPANPYADAYDIGTPETTQRFIGGGNVNWTPYSTEHQSSAGAASSAASTWRTCSTSCMRRRHCRSSRAMALPGVSTTQTTDNQYINYSINLIHHYTGSRGWTRRRRPGYVRERRDLHQPGDGVAEPAGRHQQPGHRHGADELLQPTAQRDQSFYAPGADPHARVSGCR